MLGGDANESSQKNQLHAQELCYQEVWRHVFKGWVKIFKCTWFKCLLENNLASTVKPSNKKKNTTIIFFFIFIPKWQTSRANVMASLKSLTKLPNTRDFIAAEKWIVRISSVGAFKGRRNKGSK